MVCILFETGDTAFLKSLFKAFCPGYIKNIIRLHKELRQMTGKPADKITLMCCMDIHYENFQFMSYSNSEKIPKQFIIFTEDQYNLLKETLDEEKIAFYRDSFPLYGKKEWLEIQKMLNGSILADFIEKNMLVLHFNAPNDHIKYVELYTEILSDEIKRNGATLRISDYYYINSPNYTDYSAAKGIISNLRANDPFILNTKK